MEDQRVKIVELLIQQTSKGRLEWIEGVGDNQFKVDIGSNTVIISEKTSNGSPMVTVRLYNANGTLAESFTDEDLPSKDNKEYFWYSPMSDLLNAARRKALGSDEVMKNIIDALGKPD